MLFLQSGVLNRTCADQAGRVHRVFLGAARVGDLPTALLVGFCPGSHDRLAPVLEAPGGVKQVTVNPLLPGIQPPFGSAGRYADDPVRARPRDRG